MRIRTFRRLFATGIVGCLGFSQFSTSANECEEATTENMAYCNLIRFCDTLKDVDAKSECIALAGKLREEGNDMSFSVEDAPISVPDVPAEVTINETTNQEASAETIVPVVEPVEQSEKSVADQSSQPATPVPRRESPPMPSSTKEVRSEPAQVLVQPSQSQTARSNEVRPGVVDDDPLTVKNAYQRLANKRAFSAALLFHQPSGYKSGLVVLSNGLVFKINYSKAFKPELGDIIQAKRRSILTTTSYNLVGGIGGAVTASRQRCDSQEAASATRKFCAIGQRVLDEKLVD